MKAQKLKDIQSQNNNASKINITKNQIVSKEEAIEPVSKFLKEEKIEILNSLNCTNEINFVIHVFKNFDIDHVFISIPKYEEFNLTKMEDWLSTNVEFSVQKLSMNSIKEIYNIEKPALIYIEKPYNRRKTYLTNEIEDDYELPENSIFKTLQAKSYLEKKNFLFLFAQENDFSSQLIMDLFDIKSIKIPIVLGLRYNKENKNFIKKILSKTEGLNETEKLINKFIKDNKRKTFNEEDFQQNEIFIEEEDQVKSNVYKSNENEGFKYEIFMIDKYNYKKIISNREEEKIYVLLTYKKKLETEVFIDLFAFVN